MIGLALAYLRDRAWQTLLAILLVALAVASLGALLLISERVTSRFARDAAGIDLVVGAKGSPLQLILSSVYHLDLPTGNIPLETRAMLARDPAVGRVIPLALGDSFRGFRIVGTEPAFLGLHGARVADGRLFAAEMEAVIGAEVARATGARPGQRFVGTHGLGEGGGEHDHAPFVVTGILAPTGTVTDRLILTSVESVWAVHGIAHDHGAGDGHARGSQGDGHPHDYAGLKGEGHPHDHAGLKDEGHKGHDHGEAEGRARPDGGMPILGGRTELAPEYTALLVSYANPSAAIRIPNAINQGTNLQAASPATETARFLALFDGAIAGARAFALLVAAAGALSIFTILLSATRAREGDLALLRVMGATRGQVVATVLLEGVITAGAGALLGLLLGHAAIGAAASAFPSLRALGLSAASVHPGELGILAATLGVGALAALIPAVAVFRQDLATTLARGQ
ncbi:ABC transporter permease [Thermaurantiacus sp.]